MIEFDIEKKAHFLAIFCQKKVQSSENIICFLKRFISLCDKGKGAHSQALLQIEIGYMRSGKKAGNARHVGEIGQIFALCTFPCTHSL